MSIFHRTHQDEDVRQERATGETAPVDETRTGRHVGATTVTREDAARERYGGANWGAAFFGWLVAIALVVLLGGIVGAIATAVGQNTGTTIDDLANDAGTTGLVGAIALVVVMVIGYYAGGYVAGRMSRFDGARQGAAVWLLGVIITVVAAVVGWIFGSEYDVMQRVNLPNIDLPDNTVTLGGLVTAAVVIVATLFAAMVGGRLGQRYHTKVDRVRDVV